MKPSSSLSWASSAAAGLLGLLLAAGCGKPPPAPPPPPPEPAAWTPERIAADPAGYLRHADEQIRAQMALRTQRLDDLAARRTDLDSRGRQLTDSVKDARNLHDRMATAIRRADDENRWPLKLAGRSFTREKAEAVLASTQRYVDDRGPLAAAYEDGMKRLADTENALRGDLARLERLREKMALDGERIRLNQGMAEIADLRKTEAELAAFSKALADTTEDPLADAMNRQNSQIRNLDDFLK
jgi:chromosome segregation ATPase